MTRLSMRLVLVVGMLLAQACQGGGKFQWTIPDAGPGDIPQTDVATDEGPTDPGPDAEPRQCGPGFPANACDTWAKETQGPCMTGRCNDETGTCTAYAGPSGVSCDDGDLCTVSDACLDGTCAGSPVNCDDGIACTVDRCDPDDGCLSEPEHARCDDGNICNGNETCVAGAGGGCRAGSVATVDGTCDRVDEDCDGTTDEDYLPDGACLVGACGAGGTASSCKDGVETACQAPAATFDDATCDGRDDDCDDQTDEEWAPVTECGVGTCAATATPSSCEGGVETECVPGTAADDDATCDGADDDCDGQTDEDWVPVTACGVGQCGVAPTPSSCSNGVETPCQPGAPAADDTTCDGLDDDCSGGVDEDYVPVTGCGLGRCATFAVPSSCVNGRETACQPGTPAATDATCNGADDDCDGETDEGYVPITKCGSSTCGAAPTPSSCVGGVETPCKPGSATADDATCDGRDDDCNGRTDEDYVPVSDCGAGACASNVTPSSCLGGVETPCQPGVPAADDATCDGADEDCDGSTDEDYVPDASCLGACGSGGAASTCVNGVATACVPPVPAANDPTCDGVDDDCDGSTDEDFVPDASCLVACGLGGTASSCSGGVTTACVPPAAAETDATCDGIDDDCDGAADQGYVPDASCGIGACRAQNVPSSCSGGVEAPCVAGTPAPTDATCDGNDDDCDGTADEDADPPCDQVGDPVAGARVVFTSTLGVPTGVVKDNGDGTYDGAVVDLSNPGLAGAVRATVNGNPSGDRAFSTVPVETATVLVVSTRDEAYSDDSRVKAFAYVTDALGSPVATSRTVTFRMSGAATTTAVATPSGGGVFSATLTVPAAAFTAGGAASLAADCDGVTSASAAVTVRRTPAALVLEPGEAGLELPLGPRFDTTTFDVPVYVNSGSNTIGSYDLRIDFDKAVLEVLSVGQGTATDLAPPVSNAATTANALGSLSFNAINANPAGTNARGARVQVAVARFRVRTGVAAGTTGSVTGAALGLYNTVGAGVSFLANPVIQVRDGDGPGTSGLVQVKNVTVTGVFARMDDNLLLHTGALDGVATTTGVAVLAVQADGAIADVRSAPGTTCTPTDTGVATTTGCTATAAGGGFTSITATAGGASGTAGLWVMAPALPLDVRVPDAALGRIVELDRFQQARPVVRATFQGGSFDPFVTDVTARVRFASSNPAVVAVDAATGLATPVADGAAEVQALGPGDAVIGAAAVVVDGTDLVHVTGMQVQVPATVHLVSATPDPVPDRVAALAVQARVTNLFTAEGSTAQATALLVLSDDGATTGGSRVDVSADPATAWTSSDALIGSVDAGGIVTAVGGGEALLTASYAGAGGGEIATGDGAFKVLLPKPVSVDATVADPRLALSDTDVAATLLGLPTSRPITVRVHFEDGTSKDLTADPRTRYDAVALDPSDLLSVDDVASCAGIAGCVPGTARSTGQGAGLATIGVSFPGTYLETVSTSIELQVVTHQDLTVESWELYTPPATTRVVERTLSFIEGSGVRQRSRLQVRNVFTDGSVLDVTTHPQTSFVVYGRGTTTPTAGILSIDGTALVRGLADGAVDVVALNSGHGSAPLPMDVDSATQDLADLVLTYAPGATFLGIKDVGQGAMDVYGRFADGTRNVLTGSELIPGLLDFASSATAFATIDAAGIATTRGNGPVTITVDVAPAADTGAAYDPPKPLPLAVNLVPDVGDVDLGNATGLAFPDRTGDEYFDMPIRVNTGTRTLGGIDLEVTYDPTVLFADGARVGSGIPGALFSANVSEPGRIYLNASPTVTGAGVSGSGVEVAILRFKAIKAGGGPRISPMGGTIRGFIDRTGAAIGGAVPRAIVAGAGDLDPDSSGLFGDANDDGEFSIADVLFIQQITVVPPLVVPNPTQQAQSDLFPDGRVAVNDAFYASQVLARLSHFVEAVAVPDPVRVGEVSLRTHVVDRDQQDVTSGVRVRYEVGTVSNAATIAFTGPHSGTANGVLTEASHAGAGIWSTQVSGLLAAETGIGVVVILDVLDAGGAVVNSTAFLETPLLDAAAAFKPLFTFDAAGCLPTDTTCNGIDDDCNGLTDDGYVAVGCGVGACASVSTCVGGLEHACVAGLPAANDATCNGVDDDCGGGTDEDYVPDATCGVGACRANNTPSTCVGGHETACVAGTPAANDATCNGIDDDCGGGTDEDYVPDATCGVGACRANNTPSTCVGGLVTACVPGAPAATDGTCNGVDDDCDGAVDQDACHAGATCWDDGAACDDGLAFTTGDTCTTGKCAGTAADCAPNVTFGDIVALTAVTLGPGGFPGQGLDVDGDPATCAPAVGAGGEVPGCGGGVDNEMSLLEALLNPLAADFLAGFTQGSVLGDFQHATFDGAAFVLPLYVAEVGPTTPGCDPKTETCDYVLPRHDFDGQCNPLYFFDNAKIVADLLTAGGAAYSFTVPTRYGVAVTVHGPQVRAPLLIQAGHVAGMLPGSLAAGAVRLDETLALLDAAFPGPDDTVVYGTWTKGFVRNVLQNLVAPDIDTDGDGTPDAVSFGLRIIAGRGLVVDIGTPCATAADCDDGNPCTDDACLPEAGCTQTFNDAPCSDGDPDTLQDTCRQGACVGQFRDCGAAVTFGDLVVLGEPAVGTSGFPGQGLDVDGDAFSCAPAVGGAGEVPGCSGGIDNELALTAGLLNPLVHQAYLDATWGTLVADLKELRTDGEPFPVAFYLANVRLGSGCDYHVQTCPFDVPYFNFDGQCEPRYVLMARVAGDRLTAGGPGVDWMIEVWDGTTPMSLTLYDVQIDAQLTLEGGRVIGVRQGSLAAGAIRVADALRLLDQVFPGPEDTVVYPPYTKGFVRGVLQNVLQPDVDTTGDFSPDAVSGGVLFSMRKATLGEYRPPCRTAAECDDGNPCTSDGCNVDNGCAHSWRTGACDDGDPLTVNDACIQGTCLGTVPDCAAFLVFGDSVRLDDATVGTAGVTGQGLDVDGNPATCAPTEAQGASIPCEDGVDNVLSLLSDLLGPAIADNLALLDEQTTLGDLKSMPADGSPFPLYLYVGWVAPGCDPDVATCAWEVQRWSFDAQCRPLYLFDNARFDGGVLTAGGPGRDLVVEWDEPAGVVTLTLHSVALRAEPATGNPADGFQGVYGAAVLPRDLLAVIDLRFPGGDDVVVYGTYTKGFVRGVLQNVLAPDIDTDGDGVPDALSLGGTFRTTPAIPY